MPSKRSFPPELFCLGVNPIDAAIWRPLVNCFASPMVATSAVAISGPTPRNFCSRCATGSSPAITAISRSSSTTCRLASRFSSSRRFSLSLLPGRCSARHGVIRDEVATEAQRAQRKSFGRGHRGTESTEDVFWAATETRRAQRSLERPERCRPADDRSEASAWRAEARRAKAGQSETGPRLASLPPHHWTARPSVALSAALWL